MRSPNENHMSYREIATVLGCIWQTVMVIERHALEKLACMPTNVIPHADIRCYTEAEPITQPTQNL
jgi:hypothetical protein